MRSPELQNMNQPLIPRNPSIWDIPQGDSQLSQTLDTNEQILRNLFSQSSDIIYRHINPAGQSRLLLVFVEGLVDSKRVEEIIIQHLLFAPQPNSLPNMPASQMSQVQTMGELVQGILKNKLAILSDNERLATLLSMEEFKQRSIEEPQTESVVRGPREGFVESLRTNTSLLRRRLKSCHLKTEPMTIGDGTQTDIVITYLEGIANQSVLDELHTRIQKIHTDAILDSLYIEEFIEDNPFSPFPQVQNTERPDVVVAALLEGRVGLIVDGTPHVLIVPMTFWSGLQTPQDYYERWIFTALIRFIRMGGLAITLFLTPLYVAIITFHAQLLPTSLLMSFSAARETNPFPTLFEAILMEFTFEGLREAGIRLPQNVGSAVSIVGGIVIGQAAVEAGLVSAPLVIIVATAGIASFAMPQYNLALSFRVLRYGMLLAAGFMGLYGLVIGMSALLVHLLHLRSFGVAYLSPAGTGTGLSKLRDIFIRAPHWVLSKSRGYLANGITRHPS